MSLNPRLALPQADDELWTLTAAMCQGTLSSTEAERLEEILQDREAREFYVSYLALHARLLWSGWKDGAVPPLSPPPTAPSLVRRGVSWISHPLRFSVMIALLSVVSLILTSAQIRLADRPADDLPPAVAARPEWSARWHFGRDARWEPAHAPVASGTEVQLHTRHELLAGQAELLLASGASVRIEAPARVQVLSAQRLRVERGLLLANVPPPAVGFTIEIQGSEIVDLGTEFGMVVHENGDYEAHVFQGKVRVNLPADEGAAQIITANQAVSYHAFKQRLDSLPAQASRFQSLRQASQEVQLFAELNHQQPASLRTWRSLSSPVAQSAERGIRAENRQAMLMLLYEGQKSRRDALFGCTNQRVEATFHAEHASQESGFVGVLLRAQPDAMQKSGFYMARVVASHNELRLTRDLVPLADPVRLQRPYRDGEKWRIVFEANGPRLVARVYDQLDVLQGEIQSEDKTYPQGSVGLRQAGDWAVTNCRGWLSLTLPAENNKL